MGLSDGCCDATSPHPCATCTPRCVCTPPRSMAKDCSAPRSTRCFRVRTSRAIRALGFADRLRLIVPGKLAARSHRIGVCRRYAARALRVHGPSVIGEMTVLYSCWPIVPASVLALGVTGGSDQYRSDITRTADFQQASSIRAISLVEQAYGRTTCASSRTQCGASAGIAPTRSTSTHRLPSRCAAGPIVETTGEDRST